MANETLNSTLGDLRASQVLNRDLHILLEDATDLRGLATMYTFNPGGSLVQKIGKYQDKYDFAGVGENTAAVNTAIVDGSLTLTPARKVLRFEVSDLAELGGGDVGAGSAEFQGSIVRSVGRYASQLICSLFPSFSENVGGGAGVDFSVDNAFSAIFAANAALNSEEQDLVLKPHSYNEFANSLRGESGAVARLDTQNEAVLSAAGVGLNAVWMGRRIWSTDHVVEGSGVANNALVGRGAIAMLEAPVARMRAVFNRDVTFEDAVLLVTSVMDDEKGTVRLIGNYYPAVAIQEDARGVLIASDDA